MSHESNQKNYTKPSIPIEDWSTILSERTHGSSIKELIAPKHDVRRVVEDFAGDLLSESAKEVSAMAHIAELMYHDTLSPNIRRSLAQAFNIVHRHVDHEHTVTYVNSNSQPSRREEYQLELLTDFSLISDFARLHAERSTKPNNSSADIDIEGLVDLVDRTNIESTIIKASLDYSNFDLLNSKESLTDKEKTKLSRTMNTIKTIDAPLLELWGFDALAAELLNRVYGRELFETGGQNFLDESEDFFGQFGGRKQLAKKANYFLTKCFNDSELDHRPVTRAQGKYGTHYTDGTVKITGMNENVRILSRLKSIGSTAKKMQNYSLKNAGENAPIPADIFGITLITDTPEEIKASVDYVLEKLDCAKAKYVSAPSRAEQVHIKGSQAFIDKLRADCAGSFQQRGLMVKYEACDKGYESVKITAIYETPVADLPFEIQITHEESRKESRNGIASHTLFKLAKLSGDSKAAQDILSDPELAIKLKRISERKLGLHSNKLEGMENSRLRKNNLIRHLGYFATDSQIWTKSRQTA